jgi:hypothetical protein
LGNSTNEPAEAAPALSSEVSPIASRDIREGSLIGPAEDAKNQELRVQRGQGARVAMPQSSAIRPFSNR